MMRLLHVGTSNPARIAMLQAVFKPLDVLAKPALDSQEKSLDIPEIGPSAADNARAKSLAYAQATGRPVLSIDNALYFDGLPAHEQPGIHTRQVPGIAGRASDSQLLDYYCSVIARLGGQIEGYWEFAVCLAVPQAQSTFQFYETVILSPRRFVATPSSRKIAGYPLESIQIEPEGGRYIADLNAAEQELFWQKILGPPLQAFLRPHLDMLPEL